MSKKALLLSMHSEYAQSIFRGEKTVELRRIRPNIEPDDLVIIYVTAPVAEIQGVFQVASVESGPIRKLWKQFGKEAKIKRSEFDRYFSNASVGYCIRIKKVWRLNSPTSLEKMRKKHHLRPPQGYQYVDPKVAKRLKANQTL